MRVWWESVLRFFGVHIHERKLFLIGKYALVKCVTCGAESIPWEPTLKAVEDARPHHTDDMKEYLEINERVKRERV